ncbi:ABC transporter substrate-binding protein [Kineosporia sp. NBRC 101731]|uniref:ABC transporter substrate-binding protein n=1 Tax=Kineosporia sp. NBRC 101731 TaxID=3032199 RepID=UPI0024A2B1F7|nr:ABC transporter substrate-binding protein [Kineosporia sp. NBRC 101731]GLY29719.1 glycine/betaine ABC transporter substrate-binding protein [Kineosporia sp. NBRC 101731]
MRHLAILGTGLLLASLTACGGGSDPLSAASDDTSSSGSSVVIGSANFPESQLLAEMYAQVLENAGVDVTRKFNIGSREVYIDALKDGSIDLLPEYNGALLSYFSSGKEVDASTEEAVTAGLNTSLPKGLELLEPASAQDRDALVTRAETAEKLDLESISDLAPVAGQMAIGAGAEYATRQQGLLGLKSVYGLTFKKFESLDAGGALTVQALAKDRVQVASLLSTDPAIVQNDFVVLDDSKNLFGVQNVVPLIAGAQNTPAITAALNTFSATLTTEKLTEAVGQVTIDQKEPDTVARDYLTANGLD